MNHHGMPPQPREEYREHYEDREHGEMVTSMSHGKHKKKSFFEDLFD